MCGIYGFFGLGNQGDLKRLTRQLAHRGPDGEGIFVDEELRVFLGHRRLAIRDVTFGVQPMRSQDNRYVLVYNGELYNDQNLRSQLQSLGHVFSTNCDTEVLLHSLMEWGIKSLPKLDGQFAFCFVDLQTGEAVLARDRFGEKPLFWSLQSEGVLFSSESNLIGQHPWVNPQLDEESCIRYLLLGYLPPPFSILKGIWQVRPGHAVSFNLAKPTQASEFQFAQPWDAWSDDPRSPLDSEYLSDSILDAAVASRRVSDVSVGILLSGGVDSSLIAAAASRSGWRPPTYTVGFSSESYDESAEAKRLADQLGLASKIRNLGSWDDQKVVRTLRLLDEPLGDSSFLATFEVFDLASHHSKVLLTGDGGDELFFGYEPFRAFLISEVLRKLIPRNFIRVLSRGIRKLPRSDSYMNKVDIIERFIDGLRFPAESRVPIWMTTLRTYEWSKFLTKSPSPDMLFKDLARGESGSTGLERVREFFLSSYLPGSIFAKSDTSAMANSVEARSVFLHPAIINFAMNREGSEEVSLKFGKLSLRRQAKESGLAAVASRKKHGFATPVAEILRSTTMPAPQFDSAIINQREVDLAWRKAKRGSTRHASFLWALLALVNCKSYRLATMSAQESGFGKYCGVLDDQNSLN